MGTGNDTLKRQGERFLYFRQGGRVGTILNPTLPPLNKTGYVIQIPRSLELIKTNNEKTRTVTVCLFGTDRVIGRSFPFYMSCRFNRVSRSFSIESTPLWSTRDLHSLTLVLIVSMEWLVVDRCQFIRLGQFQ